MTDGRMFWNRSDEYHISHLLHFKDMSQCGWSDEYHISHLLHFKDMSQCGWSDEYNISLKHHQKSNMKTCRVISSDHPHCDISLKCSKWEMWYSSDHPHCDISLKCSKWEMWYSSDHPHCDISLKCSKWEMWVDDLKKSHDMFSCLIFDGV
jgi:arylamine N-acetyltransferase